MKKLLSVYLIVFFILGTSFLFVKRAYSEWSEYSDLSQRANNVLITYQDLGMQISNAAVLSPELITAKISAHYLSIFSTDEPSILRNIDKLNALVRDSINIKIAKRLDITLRPEIDWIIKSNVPDSILHRRAGKHITTLEKINTLIYKGIERTRFIINYRQQRLNKSFNQLVIMLLVFLLITISLLAYAILGLFRQKAQTRKKEGQLLEKDVQFRYILDNMIEGIQIHDFNWRYTYVNDSSVGYSPYSRQELLGYTLMEKYPGIENTDLFKTLERCMQDRISKLMETEFVFPNGSKADFELSIQPVPEGIFILSVDITDRNNSKRKLAKANRLYSFLSAINQSIVYVNDKNKLLDRICQIATEVGQFKLAYIGLLDSEDKLNIASLSGDKLGAEKILKVKGLDVNDPAYKNVPTVQVLKTGKCNYHNDMQNDPVFAQWKNDFMLHGIHASISLPIFKFGKAIGILGLHAGSAGFFDTEEIDLLVEATGDISFALENFEKASVHKETEDLVLKNERRFRGLIEKSADFKSLTDKNGRLTYGSPSVLSFFDYSMEEFIGKEAMSFFHPDDVSDLISKRNTILHKPGASYKFQYRIAHKNGNWIWCEGTATNFLDEPAIQAIVTNFRDISESRKNALEKENLIKQLTLNNQDLRQFAYITSHNLRGPIANLLGLTSLLDTIKTKDPTLSKILTGIRTATAMFDETIKDLATVLTLRDNPDIQLETISFETIFDKVRNFCEHSLTECQAEIFSDYNASPMVSFNKSYLESIFLNLLTNAIKYKDNSRQLKILVRTYVEDEHIVLKFSDNGIGFDSEMQKEKVFKLYQRFHVHKEGKGLGLFLIKSQLDALGGAIEVESIPNSGTTFTIKFNAEYNLDLWK